MSPVRLRLPAAFLQAIFRLPENVTLQDAAVEQYGGTGPAVLTLTVDMPGAPPGAVSAGLTYTRQTALPDPVQITGYSWFREDGTEITGDV